MPPVRFPRTVRGRVAAGTGMAAVGGYGVQVGRAGRAEYAQRNFTNEDSREYNRAADQWVAAGKGKGKRFKAKYYNQSRRQFVRDNPRSKLVRPTVRRWEDRFANVQRMRQAPKGTPSAGEILLHPVKSRHRSDAAIMRRLVAGGSSKDVYRAMLLDKKPSGAFRQRPLSSWTPHKDIADSFVRQHGRYQKHKVGSVLANQPRGLSRSARGYVVQANVRSANLSPLSRFGNVDEQVSVRQVPRGQRVAKAAPSLSSLSVWYESRLG